MEANYKTNEFKFLYYSERGLINLFIQELVKLETDDKRKEVIEYILDKLKTGDGGKDPKIKDKDEYKWFNLVVEPSFGKFGDPDLLILTSTGQGGKYHCFFVEAKRDSLSKALTQKGSSNIVRQLINKMKFAEAKIIENRPNKKTYEWAIEYQKGTESKKLKNKASLDIINLILSEKITLGEVLKDYTEFHYIFLTNEKDDKANYDNGKKNMEPNNSELRDIIKGKRRINDIELNNDLTLWEKNWNSGRITFLTYEQIANAFKDAKVEKSFAYVLNYYRDDISV